MLFNPRNPLLKYLVVAVTDLVDINHMPHNLIVGLFLVGVDRFDVELSCIGLPMEASDVRLKRLLPGFKSR